MYFTVTVERMLPVVENKNSVGALEAQKVARHNTNNIDQTCCTYIHQTRINDLHTYIPYTKSFYTTAIMSQYVFS